MTMPSNRFSLGHPSLALACLVGFALFGAACGEDASSDGTTTDVAANDVSSGDTSTGDTGPGDLGPGDGSPGDTDPGDIDPGEVEADAVSGDDGTADSGDDAAGDAANDAGTDTTVDAGPTLTSVSGVAQKGPLVAGSALTLQVLDETLTQTGDSFSADIQNNDGFFSLGNVDLDGNPFLEIFADGYYYNEVTNEISNDRLALFTLADTGSSDININVLSHLERPRTRHLYENPEQIDALNPDGTLTGDDVTSQYTVSEIFEGAKVQAQTEVLAAFEVDASSLELDVSESFNIANSSTGDQILTAVSVILQAYRSVGEMTELLANLSSDLEEDGTLDSQELLNELFTGVTFVNTETVTDNLIDRFDTLDETNASGWVPYVETFLATTAGELDGGPVLPELSPVTYANTGEGKLYSDQPNVLAEDVTCIADSGYFGFAAEVPDAFSLKVTLTVTDGYVGWHARGDESGWDESGGDVFIIPDPMEVPEGTKNNVGETQSFVTDLASDAHELEFRLSGLGTVEVAYFANGLSGAYLTKTITVMSCDETVVVEIETGDPENPMETMEVGLCDYSDSEATCDNPTERLDTPVVEPPI